MHAYWCVYVCVLHVLPIDHYLATVILRFVDIMYGAERSLLVSRNH